MNLKSIVSPAVLNFVGTLSIVAGSVVAVSAQEVAVGGRGVFDFSVGFRLPIEAKIVKGAPFSADIITESIQTLSDGNRIVQRSNTRFYRDSEGRVRREEERPSGGPAITITDPVSRLSFSLDVDNHIARQTPNVAPFKAMAFQHVQDLLIRLPPGMGEKVSKATVAVAPFEARLEGEKVTVEKLPARDIEGVRAEGTRRTTTITAGAIGNELPIEIVSEEWTSPDLNVLVMTERRDPRLGTSTYRLTNIIRAEPDRYLFELPADYTVRTDTMHKTGPALRK